MDIGVKVRIPEFRGEAGLAPPGDLPRLVKFFEHHPRVLVITGAGCSTGSGIPAYRDREGRWQQAQPIQYQAFMKQPAMRQRYWARSYLGWPRMAEASPNGAHHALAALQHQGRLSGIVTQNVDGLHQRAGCREVVELHGSLDEVVCMQCGAQQPREAVQAGLRRLNPRWQAQVRGINPDGDARLDEEAYTGFRILHCEQCQGIIKPNVVFFGESVPPARVEQVRERLAASDAVLVIGSSLVVWSAFRFVREASAAGLPVAAVNEGRTRADELLAFKVAGSCDQLLEATARALAVSG